MVVSMSALWCDEELAFCSYDDLLCFSLVVIGFSAFALQMYIIIVGFIISLMFFFSPYVSAPPGNVHGASNAVKNKFCANCTARKVWLSLKKKWMLMLEQMLKLLVEFFCS